MPETRYFYADINAKCGSVYHNEETMPGAAFRSGNCEDGDAIWEIPEYGANITVHREKIPGTSAIRQSVTLKNDSSANITADSLSSLFVPGIGVEGSKRWYEHRFVVHYARMAWQGEGQWHHQDIQELGLYSTYNHGHQSTIRFSSVGTWTTAQIYPCVMLEDTELNETWYFEIESCANWHIEIGARGYRHDSGLYVMLSAAHEAIDGWFKTLRPGESFTTVPGVYGKVKGGFEEAVCELNKFKRINNHALFPGNITPVCFNDYMNCLWAQPSEDRLLPLIDKAAEVGCEVFCIDAGWFGDRCMWNIHNADYIPNDALFPTMKLQGILDYIKEKGMLPGLWLEIETADVRSDYVKAHPKSLLTRHGNVINPPQGFLDYRQKGVCEHMMSVFDRLYAMGVRYIKNDYNHTVGVGIDGENSEANAQELHKYTKAFFSFVDDVTSKYPDMYIENCGSGAMRCNDGALSHFYLQSTSDQEYYNRYPSIVQGMLALMPPEKTGIWSYPLPVDFHEREIQLENYPLIVDHILPDAKSGVQTAFNMVNAMMGAIYLSGRICYADDLNTKLMKDSIALYKNVRAVVANAHPVYPTGTVLLDHDGYATVGLLSECDKKLLLAVWRINCPCGEAKVDISAYVPSTANVTATYPVLPGFEFSFDGENITVKTPEDNSAMWFEISF